ncbi:c-type cytochrome [Aquimarina rhabdastrellae]
MKQLVLYLGIVLWCIGCAPEQKESKKESIKASEKINLTDKGIGPVTTVTLETTINEDLKKEGQVLFQTHCLSCHKTHKKLIGPAMVGILDRRTPEWTMNMILNPYEMTKKNPLAKALLEEYNGSPMVKQITKETQARAILEYLRTLE